MSKLKVLMFGCSSNFIQSLIKAHSCGVFAALQPHDMSEILCISDHARKSLISDIPRAKMASPEAGQ